MTLRTLAYQQRVLSLLDAYLDALVQQRAKAERLEQINAEQPDTALHYLPLNFPEHTWQEIQAGLPASPLQHTPFPPYGRCWALRAEHCLQSADRRR